MAAYLYGPPNGVAGDVSRVDESNIEPAMMVPTGTAPNQVYPQAFGIPVKYVAGGVQQYSGGEAATDFAGVLIREIPGITAPVNNNYGNTVTAPLPAQPVGVCVRGYVSVLCTYGTPVRGGVVYVRVTANANGAVGAFEATADGGNNVALTQTQASWATDGKDAFNNAELRIAR